MKNHQKGFIVALFWGIVALLLIALGVYTYINRQLETSVSNHTENIISKTSNSIVNTQNTSNSITQTKTDYQNLFNYASGDYMEKYEDLNFDGLIDKVLVDKNSTDAYRGSPHKTIYVQTNSGNYVLSNELTQLINGVGSFTVNKLKKIITTYGAGSCCTHYGSKYIVVPNVGLKEVYKISEEAGS